LIFIMDAFPISIMAPSGAGVGRYTSKNMRKTQMIRLKQVNYVFLFVGVIIPLAIFVSGADGKPICSENTDCLRIVYGGGLTGKIAPCG